MKALYIHTALLLIGSAQICQAASQWSHIPQPEGSIDDDLDSLSSLTSDDAPPQETAADLTDFQVSPDVRKLVWLAARAVINTRPSGISLTEYLKKGGVPEDAPTLRHAVDSTQAIQQTLQIFQQTACFIRLDSKCISTEGIKAVALWLQNRLVAVAEGSPVLPARPHHIEVLNRVLYETFSIEGVLEKSALEKATYLLTKAGADIDHIDVRINTLLIRATLRQIPLHVKILLENGANVNKHDSIPFSPLMHLISNGFPHHWKKENVREVFELLLQHGAIVTPEMLDPRANMPPDIRIKLQKAYARKQAPAAQGAAAAPAAH